MRFRIVLLTGLLLSCLAGILPAASAQTGSAGLAAKAGKPALVVEEYKVVSRDVDTPDHVEFNRRLSPAALGKQQKLKTVEEEIEQINSELRPFGYRFQARPGKSQVYDFYRHDSLAISCIGSISGFKLNETGDKFLFGAWQGCRLKPPLGRSLFVYNGRIEESQEFPYAALPIFVGDTLVTVYKLKPVSPHGKPCGPHEFVVKKTGEPVFHFSGNDCTIDDFINLFFALGQDRVLELRDTVIVNGVDLGKQRGYTKVFFYQELAGKPFFFFEQNKKIHISYGGEELPYVYDEVIYNKCCEPGGFNPRKSDDMVVFYALRNDYWYYVKAGIYDQ
jgi:hypothetical protein